MIRKAFNNNKDIYEFCELYNKNKVKTLNIENYFKNSKENDSYLLFRLNKSRLNKDFQKFISSHLYNAMTFYYGSYDFLLSKKNRNVPVFVFKLHQTLFVITDHIEIVVDKLNLKTIIEFEKKIFNLILNYYQISSNSNCDKEFSNFSSFRQ